MYSEQIQKLREDIGKSDKALRDLLHDPNISAVQELTSEIQFLEEANKQLRNKVLPHLEGGKLPVRLNQVETDWDSIKRRLELLEESTEDTKIWKANVETKLGKISGYVF